MLSSINDSFLKSREELDFKECAAEDEYMTEKILKHFFKNSMEINYSIIHCFPSLTFHLL